MMRFNKKAMMITSVVILLCLSLGFGYYYMMKKDKPAHITYNQFLVLMEQGKIGSVNLVDEANLTGKMKDGSIFTTDNPRTVDYKEMLLKNNIQVEENTPNQQLMSIIGVIGFIALFVGMGIFLPRHSSQQTSREFSKMSSIETLDENNIQVTFANIAGNDEAKENIMDLVDFLKNPDKYAKYGARIPRGVILYGPPGTGKTLLAKALAGEANVPYFAVSGSDFVQIYAGLGAGRIRTLFKKAREKGRAIIFIDEIDALGKKRDGINGSDETDRTLNALLTEMSGFNDHEGIIVIAATNRLDTLDEALLRPGRFDRQVEVGLPDVSARYQILKLHSRKKPLEDAVDLEKLAHQTVYFSGASLENLLNEAAILAAKENANHIRVEHVNKAFYTVIAGDEKKDRTNISVLDREITAYHEAGHALATKLLMPENRVTKVTIIPSTKGAGGFSMNIPPDRLYRTKTEMLNNIRVALAGRAAEELIFGADHVTTGAANDIEKATNIALAMIKRFGMNERVGIVDYSVLYKNSTAEPNQDIVTECKKLMDQLYMEVKLRLEDNRILLENITRLLLEKETLEEEDLNHTIQQHHKKEIASC
ncbi:MAG: ATP-dependent metallopeptidase FtsH/Yme1/Tma family protein [Bacillota bacterium]